MSQRLEYLLSQRALHSAASNLGPAEQALVHTRLFGNADINR